MRNGRNKILQTIHRNAAAIRGYGVRRLGLFGSAARNQARANSDLDILVDFGSDLKDIADHLDLADAKVKK